MTSGRRFHTSTNRHQSVNEARKGPGYLFRPLWYRLYNNQEAHKMMLTDNQCSKTRCRTCSTIPCCILDENVLVEEDTRWRDSGRENKGGGYCDR